MRPDWDTYYLGLCWLIKERSRDTRTKHGSIITLDNKVVGIGYNGFPSGSQDDLLPKTPPNKYDFTAHAELNAIYNSNVKPKGGTIYITGKPCPTCLVGIVQNGIKRVVYADREGTRLEPYDPFYLEKLTNMHKIDVVVRNIDTEWIKNCL